MAFARSDRDDDLAPLRREPGGASLDAGSQKPRGVRRSLLLADDVAAMVGMTKEWVYAETRAGRIPHITLGRYYRYRPESIETWLAEVERRSSGTGSLLARRR